MLQTVERQGRCLSRLITDLLLLTSLEQDISPLSFKPCCLNDLVTDLTEELSELAAASDIHLAHHLPGSEPKREIYVLGHESQLYRLVSNLIANAIQYTPPGRSVLVSLDARNHRAIIAIKDTGIGTALPDQAKIFDRFYRVNPDRSRYTGCSGLGLAIARAIAKPTAAIFRSKVQSAKGAVSPFSCPEQPRPIPKERRLNNQNLWYGVTVLQLNFHSAMFRPM